MEEKKYAEYFQIYVWQLPVRFFHWVNFVCIVVLSVTGYLIGKPIVIYSSQEASFRYWFGTVRFIHFVFAYIFLFNYLFRFYWGFVGNRYARWNNFIPYKISQWKEILHVLCLDIIEICRKPLHSVGHNALAGLTYFLVFLATIFQTITGFGLYSAMSKSPFPKLFSWIIPLMGGDYSVRSWHHIMMWFFVIFSIVHIYLVSYHDYIEERATVSSMIGGWKFIEKEVLKK